MTEQYTFLRAQLPIAILTKCLGLFPARNLLRGPYGSRERVTTIVFLSLQVSKHVFTMVLRWDLFKGMFLTFDNVKAYVTTGKTCLETLTWACNFVSYQMCFTRFCRLIDKVSDFDNKIGTSVGNRELRKYGVYLVLSGAAYLTLFLPAYVAQWYTLELRWDVGVHFLTLLYTNLVNLMPTLHVLFMSKAVCMRFAAFNTQVMHLVQHLPRTFAGKTLVPVGDDTEKVWLVGCPYQPHEDVPTEQMGWTLPKQLDVSGTLSEFCGAFDHLHEIVEDMSRCLGIMLAVTYPFLIYKVFLFGAVLLLGINSTWDWYTSLPLDIDGVLSLVMLVAMTFGIGNVASKSMEVLPYLRRVRTLSLGEKDQEQFQALLQRVSQEKVQMTATDFFVINRSVLTSFAAVIMTYLVVVAQFKN